MTERSDKGQFLLGHTGLGGRPKGARQKLGEKFLGDMLADWETNGIQAIADMRAKNPTDYCKVVASILPKEIAVTVSEYDELSDDELAERFAVIAAQLGFGSTGDRGRAGAQALPSGRRVKPAQVH